jgi:hypothetical protein
MIEANVVLALVAMAGAAFFMALGYINQRAIDAAKAKTTEIKTGYILLTLLTMSTAAAVYENDAEAAVTLWTLFRAFMFGVGVNGGLSKMVSAVGNLNANLPRVEQPEE